eukprot:gene8664-biopygen9757
MSHAVYLIPPHHHLPAGRVCVQPSPVLHCAEARLPRPVEVQLRDEELVPAASEQIVAQPKSVGCANDEFRQLRTLPHRVAGRSREALQTALPSPPIVQTLRIVRSPE